MTSKKQPSVFHILLIATAAVLFWRGTWGLMDLYIFPDNPALSYVLSLVVGLGILIAMQRLSDGLL